MAGMLYTSPEEIEILKAAEANKRQGARGKGYADPRIVTPESTQGIGDRLAITNMLQRDELKGEIMVRISAAPGLNVQAETKSNSPRIPFRTDVGQTMMGAGH